MTYRLDSAPCFIATDGYTLHQWLCSDTGSPLADTGTGANAPLTPQNTTYVYYSHVGLFHDCVSFHTNTSLTTSGGYATSSSNVGIPTSTTTLSLHGWIKVRTLNATNVYPRMICKDRDGTNESVSLFFSGTTDTDGTLGQIYFQWYSGGAVKNAVLPNAYQHQSIAPINQWFHVGVTFVQSGTTASTTFYFNGNQAGAAISTTTGVIDWNSGSSGPWYMGYYAGAAASQPIDAEFMDWRYDDGIARSAAYFKALYKAGVGYGY